jgi:hypothetical protein
MIAKFQENLPEWELAFRLLKWIVVIPLASNGYIKLWSEQNGTTWNVMASAYIPFLLIVVAIEVFGLRRNWMRVFGSKRRYTFNMVKAISAQTFG